jgi:hypothetical protein
MKRDDFREYAPFLWDFVKQCGGSIIIAVVTSISVGALAWAAQRYLGIQVSTETPSFCSAYRGNLIVTLLQLIAGCVMFTSFMHIVLIRRFDKESLLTVALMGVSLALVMGAVGSIVCLFHLSPEWTMEVVAAGVVVVGFIVFSAGPSNAEYFSFLLGCVIIIAGVRLFIA